MKTTAAAALAMVLLASAPSSLAQSIILVTLGDSLTAGDGDDGAGGGFPARLIDLLEADYPGSTLDNVAVSGHTSNDLINVQLGPAVTLLDAAPAGNRAIATVWIGSNDLFGLYNWVCDNEYGNDYEACEAAQFATYSANLDTILTTLQETGAEVFVALLDDQSRRPVMTDPALREASYWQISAEDVARMSAQVLLYNDEIARQAAALGMTTVDFFHTTIFEDWDTLAVDGNHPNGAGYDQIAAIWYQAISGGAPTTYRLTVTKNGTGIGTVTSDPAGIDCGSDCSHDFGLETVVTLTATPAAGSTFAGWSGDCSGTADCTVTMSAPRSVRATFDGPSGMDYAYVVPVVVHGPGESGTNWRSSVVCLNRTDEEADLALSLATSSGTWSASATVAAAATMEWEDIVVDLFGAPPDESTAGALHVAATQPLLLTSRTFNQGDAGTYGQYLPSLTTADALSGTDHGYLLNLKGIGFRTNVGFVNLGDSTCQVRLTLYDADGTAIGHPTDTTVAPGEWVQRNDVFDSVDAQPQSLAYALVELPSGIGSFWAYASVVDGDTGDATTIPVLVE